MFNDIIQNLRNQQWMKHLINQRELWNFEVYIVGGCVRDALMNKSPKDIDIVIDGLNIDDVKELLKNFGKVSIVGQSFSVLKFRPDGHVGEDYDIAVPRIDRKIGVGHKGFEVQTEGVDIKGDLKRRDFTVNSIAVNVRTGKILDPFNGKKDLFTKTLRATDQNAFIEDPLRIVRAIQFASRFKFDIESNTLNLMKKNASLINEISGERIKEEFDKILLKKGSTKTAFDLIEKSDLDKALFGRKFSKEGFKYFDDLDLISFYYILGELGRVSPSAFYIKRLKGEYHIGKAIQTIEKYFDKFNTNNVEELRWNVFQMIKTSPLLVDAKVLPKSVSDVIEKMKAGEIPMKIGDIPVNGNDIIDILKITGPEVGEIMDYMYRNALMKKFNWKNKEKTMKFLKLQ